MYKLAVIGNPIEHSLSPLIWTQFAKQLDIPLEYTKILAREDNFESVVEDFFKSGGKALSVTAPFKARAFNLAKVHNQHTLIPHTANLLIQDNNQIIADNTDGLGLVADLERMSIDLAHKHILIIGSGSVIYSVLSSLLAKLPSRVDLLMRNQDKLSEFMSVSNFIKPYNSEISYDLVINTTPNSPDNKLFAEVKSLSNQAVAYDMIYTAQQTLFMQSMQNINPAIKQANGIGMLIQQAKVAFELVFNQVPNAELLYPLLQEKFNG